MTKKTPMRAGEASVEATDIPTAPTDSAMPKCLHCNVALRDPAAHLAANPRRWYCCDACFECGSFDALGF